MSNPPYGRWYLALSPQGRPVSVENTVGKARTAAGARWLSRFTAVNTRHGKAPPRMNRPWVMAKAAGWTVIPVTLTPDP